jgi:hypothetical protein
MRAVRNTWPFTVEEVAILRNTSDNPSLDPSRMAVALDTYLPSKEEGMESSYFMALTAAKQGPTEKGGFVIRLTERGSDSPVYIPLRGLTENGVLKPDFQANPLLWMIRSPMEVGFGLILVAACLGPVARALG